MIENENQQHEYNIPVEEMLEKQRSISLFGFASWPFEVAFGHGMHGIFSVNFEIIHLPVFFKGKFSRWAYRDTSAHFAKAVVDIRQLRWYKYTFTNAVSWLLMVVWSDVLDVTLTRQVSGGRCHNESSLKRWFLRDKNWFFNFFSRSFHLFHIIVAPLICHKYHRACTLEIVHPKLFNFISGWLDPENQGDPQTFRAVQRKWRTATLRPIQILMFTLKS